MSFLRAHKVALGIFVLALVLRCLYMGASYAAHDGNLARAIQGADGYYVVSNNLIQGNGFSSDSEPPYTPYSFRPPLYPYFIAAAYFLFGGYWGVIAFQILIGSVLPLLGMKIAQYITSRRGVAVAVGVLLAVEPSGILYSTFFYSETLFMLFFLVSFLYLCKYFTERSFFNLGTSAVFMGAAALTRPTVEFLPYAVVVFLLWEARKHLSRRTLFHIAGYGAVFLLTLSPWLYRNQVVFGETGLSPQGGVNLYTVLVPSVLAVQNGTTFQEEYDAHATAGVTGPNETSISGAEGYVSRAIPILLEHPLALMLLTGNTAFTFFTHDGVFDVLRHLSYYPDILLGKPALFVLLGDPLKIIKLTAHFATTPTAFILLARLFWVLATVAFLAGAYRYMRYERKSAALAALLVILYFLLVTLVIGLAANARYRLPVNALILTIAACQILYLKERWLPGKKHYD